MKNNGLTLTMIFEAESANYGEGIGNISQLKKMARGDGEMYTYISRQAIRYNIVKEMGCDNTPVEDAGVVQFAPTATIADYPEIDLFGYMKTSSKKEDKKGGQKIRSAVVRLSNAISLEPYNSDLDYLTNMGLSKRIDGLENVIAQSEIHRSLYSYTITIDLDRIGIDENDNIELSNTQKADRVKALLETIEYLYRDIKGRRENLAPVFAIGGVYERKNPYFEGRINLRKNNLNVGLLQEIIDSNEDVKKNTIVGVLEGFFSNTNELPELYPVSISKMFITLKNRVTEYYG